MGLNIITEYRTCLYAAPCLAFVRSVAYPAKYYLTKHF